MSSKNLYRQAGVDIDAGRAFVEKIAPIAASTMRRGASSALGGFGGLFDLAQAGYHDPILVSATDGVGTKLLLAQQAARWTAARWAAIGQDLVAMSVNDVVAQGAEPLFFLDYIACGKLAEQPLAEIIAGMAAACRAAGCALIGGETAEMPRLYQPAQFDLAGFAVGAVERDQLLPKTDASQGDIILALASDGLHANGFSLIHQMLSDRKFSLDAVLADSALTDSVLADALLQPTRLYVSPILSALREGFEIKGIAHITGGGVIENLPRALPDPDLALKIDRAQWESQPIFSYLQEKGNISDEEMLNVFNCGIGLAVIISEKEADALSDHLTRLGENVFTIGHVCRRRDDKITIKR